MIEQGVVEKFAHRDAQAVADFLNGNDAWVLAFCIQHAIDRGRCDAAAGAAALPDDRGAANRGMLGHSVLLPAPPPGRQEHRSVRNVLPRTGHWAAAARALPRLLSKRAAEIPAHPGGR